MPLDGTVADLETDFEILEALGWHVDALVEPLARSDVLMQTVRHWIVGHAPPPEDQHAFFSSGQDPLIIARR